MTTNQLITKLYDEVMDYRGEVVNFASFLRVSCTRYLSQRPSVAQSPARLSVLRG
jgi:predicted DNA-binding ribbon-helix-helix protein